MRTPGGAACKASGGGSLLLAVAALAAAVATAAQRRWRRRRKAGGQGRGGDSGWASVIPSSPHHVGYCGSHRGGREGQCAGRYKQHGCYQSPCVPVHHAEMV